MKKRIFDLNNDRLIELANNDSWAQWLLGWIEDRFDVPVELKIDAQLPLEEGSHIKVEAWNDLSYWKVHNSINKTTEGAAESEDRYFAVPVVLFDQEISDSEKIRLFSAMELVRKVQGVEPIECFAFMVQLYIMTVDYFRSESDLESVLLSPSEEQVLGKTEKGRKEFERLLNRRPFFLIDDLLSCWDLFGGLWIDSKGLAANPDGSIGLPSYMTIPASWKSSSESDGGSQVPLMVDSQFIRQVEVLSEACSKFTENGINIQVSPGIAEPERKIDIDVLEVEDCIDWIVDGEQIQLANLTQARAAKFLYEKLNTGYPRQPERAICEAAEYAPCRIRDLFKKNPALGKLIIKVGRAIYELNPNAKPSLNK